jgi:hypothetical protein
MAVGAAAATCPLDPGLHLNRCGWRTGGRVAVRRPGLLLLRTGSRSRAHVVTSVALPLVSVTCSLSKPRVDPSRPWTSIPQKPVQDRHATPFSLEQSAGPVVGPGQDADRLATNDLDASCRTDRRRRACWEARRPRCCRPGARGGAAGDATGCARPALGSGSWDLCPSSPVSGPRANPSWSLGESTRAGRHRARYLSRTAAGVVSLHQELAWRPFRSATSPMDRATHPTSTTPVARRN